MICILDASNSFATAVVDAMQQDAARGRMPMLAFVH
jgi:hypothetical protein